MLETTIGVAITPIQTLPPGWTPYVVPQLQAPAQQQVVPTPAGNI